MKEADNLKKTCENIGQSRADKLQAIDDAIEKVRVKRQEQTGKPYRKP